MLLPGRSRWTVLGIPMLLVFVSGRLLPQSNENRAVPDSIFPVNTKVDNSMPPPDPYVEFSKQHNHGGLCPLGMVSQRNNTVCCLPTSCKPGYGLVPCSDNGTEDICEQCKEGFIQRLNVSSLNMTNTECFKPSRDNHNICPLDDFHAVKEGWYSELMPYSCECAVERCHWKGPHSSTGTCDTVTDCPAYQQLNKFTGKCEPCPWYADKDQPGCWPCVINVTLLRLGHPDPNAPVRQTTMTIATYRLSPELPQQLKSDQHESKSGHTTTHIALFSIAGVLGLLCIVVSLAMVAICRRRQSNHSACQNWVKDISIFFRGPSQGSSNNLLSTPISPPTTPTSYDGHSNFVDMSPSPSSAKSDNDGLQTREAHSVAGESRPRVHNSTNVSPPRRAFLINQGQINGVNSFMGQNEGNSSPMNSDAELEPLLPLTPDESQPKTKLYPNLSALINTTGSTSCQEDAALRPLEELNRIYHRLNSEFSTREYTMGVTVPSTAGELVVSEAQSSDSVMMHTGSKSTRFAACSDDVSTTRTKDLKAIGVEPSREATVHKSKLSSGEECNTKKCKGNNADNKDDNARVGGGSTINFNAPINNSVININIDGGAVRIGGEEQLGRRHVERLQGRSATARALGSTINEEVGQASTLTCNNMNEGINELVSTNENIESCQASCTGMLPYNINVDKKENNAPSDPDEGSGDEKSCLEVKLDNKANIDEASSQGIHARPVVRVAPMVLRNSNRHNSNRNNSFRHNSDDMAVPVGNSSFSSGYAQVHMSQPMSNTTQALYSEQSEGTEQIEDTTGSRDLQFEKFTSSNCANTGSMSPSTALQMEELKYWEQASQTVPKTVDCDADERETTSDRTGRQELPDPDQTERKELADDGDSNEQTHVKHVTGMEDD